MGAAAREENPKAPRAAQSPFALAMGRNFEANLIDKDAELLLESLQRASVISSTSRDFADHRWRSNGGPLASLDAAITEGGRFLTDLAAGKQFNGVIASFSVRIPKGIMLPEANLIVDVLTVQSHGPTPEISVGEIKTYPDQGGHTSRANLSTARAQMGLYVHALEVTLESLGLTDKIKVSHVGFLVLTHAGSMRPNVRANEDLKYQRERARRGFELMEESALMLHGRYGGAVDDEDQDLLDLVLNAATSFQDSCIAFCERAPVCYAKALRENRGVALGNDVETFLNGVPLDRAVDLLNDDRPLNSTETDLLARMTNPLPELP
jgi:hypothetical protein